MDCPECSVTLEDTDCHGVKIDECPKCLGRWFDRDELRRAKDSTDPDLRWLDFDPFADEVDDSEPGAKGKLCPRCSIGMGVIAYEDSGVRLDKCSRCRGVWLNHGEFERIVKHLEKEVNAETARQLGKEAERQFAQILTGSEGPISELRDLFSVLHLLRQRWSVEHPALSGAIDTIYAVNPFK
jgi:Zn-finger nucleic acid-binding protein